MLSDSLAAFVSRKSMPLRSADCWIAECRKSGYGFYRRARSARPHLMINKDMKRQQDF
jgi:hypothetical protein